MCSYSWTVHTNVPNVSRVSAPRMRFPNDELKHIYKRNSYSNVLKCSNARHPAGGVAGPAMGPPLRGGVKLNY
jgi:hypothetical protein